MIHNLMIILSLILSSTLLAQTEGGEANKSGIYIDVGQAQVSQSRIAILPPSVDTKPEKVKAVVEQRTELFKTIQNDLATTGLFQLIKPDEFLESPISPALKPQPGDPSGFSFQPWIAIKTQFLVRWDYRLKDDGQFELTAYLYYVPQAKLVMSRTYQGSRDATRRMAHTFANDLVKSLTGKPGMFLSRVVVSSDRTDPEHKEIFVMDWDGENAKQITHHQTLSISPAWSPDLKKVAYTSFAYHKNAKSRNADLFVYELDTGKRYLVSYRKGINSGAVFAPDNKHLFLTVSQGGSPDIFRMGLDGEGLTAITKGPDGVMNVEPAISPDGKTLAFSSDRGTLEAGGKGRPMIYTMDTAGGSPKRVTWAGKYNSTPTWSPDGKRIAFAGFEKDHFDIFIINADGSKLERLTEALRVDTKRPSSNEDPTFSPDGRHIMFVSDRSGTKQLWIVNPDGTNERRITYDNHNYFKPKWSSLGE